MKYLVLRELIKIRHLVSRAGQINKMWGRSQILSFMWSVQSGEFIQAKFEGVT